MAENPLFDEGIAGTDPAYLNVRSAKHEHLQACRTNCEQLWEIFEPYADAEFRLEIAKEFEARYWEMYLTCYFIGEGFGVTCPKQGGPDVGILVDGQRIWFEATAPNRGADGHPDQVPALRVAAPGEAPVVQNTPNEQLVLRYLNSISEKYERQYPRWLKAGIVGADDAFVIAINPRRLGHEMADTIPPRILQAAFTIGAPYVVLDAKSVEQVGAGYLFRNEIRKAGGTAISTGVFQTRDHPALSGLLCSRVNAANQPAEMGADFQLVPNPNAQAPLPEALRLKGIYFAVQSTDEGYVVTPEGAEGEA